MFKLLVPITLALLVTAAPQSGTTVVAQCNTGSVMCCNSMQDASSNTLASLLELLGIDVGNATASNGQVGVGCTAVGVDGGVAQGASCSQQPVCCDGDTFNGLINFGCNSISISL